MMDNNGSEVVRGNQARDVLDHPLYKEAFDAVREELSRLWLASRASEADQREQIYLSRKLLDRLELHLRSVMETGQMAQMTLAEKARRTFGNGTVI